MEVFQADDFPKEPGFRVQIRNEYLNVTGIEGNRWTVERGVERTTPEAYLEGMPVELVRLDPEQTNRTLEDFRALVASNIFVKPLPPYRLKLLSLTEKVVTRGKTIDFTIGATGYDTLQAKPVFSLVGSPPAGLKLDPSGKVTWKPADDVAAGKYEISFEVRHP